MQWFPSYFSLEDVDSDGDLDPVSSLLVEPQHRTSTLFISVTFISSHRLSIISECELNSRCAQVIASGKGRFVFIIILAVEHALGLFTHLLDVCIPNVPKSVRIALKKKEYEAEKVLSTIKRSAQKTEESTQE